MRFIALILAGLPQFAQADALFPIANPYGCVAEARRSSAPDAERRTSLAKCMSQTNDYYQAVKALQLGGFYVSELTVREIELTQMSGEFEKAGALLTRVIMTGQ